jgi:hypothetical protein
MSKLLAFLAVALVLAGSPRLFAAPGWSWSTSLDTIVAFGDTRYLMELPYEYVTYGVSSELIFPLNTFLEGITFRGERVGEHFDGRRDWGFELSLAVNLLAPFGVMKDSDWWMDYGYPKMQFSYTESEATMLWLAASADWKLAIATGSWGNLSLDVGYRLHYVDQEAIDYKGWVYEDITSPPDTDPAPPNTPDGVPEPYYLDGSGLGTVLTYWVLWNALTAGCTATLAPMPGLSVVGNAGLAAAYVADADDHVLRYKLSKASGVGIGCYAELEVRYTFGKAESRVRPFLSLAGSILYMKANTEQTQTYYTGATEAPPGTSYTGIDHQISTKQFTAGLAFGVTY